MRCAEARPLIDAYVDGSLTRAVAARVEDHTAGCKRCAREISLARRVNEALSGVSPKVRAPKGFADRVMDGVYRQALAGASAVPETSADPRRAPSRMYRRLGLSFVVTATVLATTLLVPRVAYPTLFASAGLGPGGTSVVREAMQGADSVVQKILSEQSNGGRTQ